MNLNVMYCKPDWFSTYFT